MPDEPIREPEEIRRSCAHKLRGVQVSEYFRNDFMRTGSLCLPPLRATANLVSTNLDDQRKYLRD